MASKDFKKEFIELINLLTSIELYVLQEFLVVQRPISVGKVHSNIAIIAYKLTQKKNPPKTINQTKEELAKLQVTIPSFNRIKRILHMFNEWGIITTRKGTGRAKDYYILTNKFREQTSQIIKTPMVNNKHMKLSQQELIADYIGGGDY